MKTSLLAFMLLILFLDVRSQKHDYNWMMAGSSGFPEEKDGVKLDFNQGKRTLTNETFPHLIDQQNGTMSDKDGKLLFYSDGCRVIGADHQVVENGDSLNYGEWYSYINDCKYGYTGQQNMIILPDPGNEDGYYLLHLRFDLTPQDTLSSVGNVDYLNSYVDVNANFGKGILIFKNKLFFRRIEKFMALNAAVKHENNKDWWILAIGNYSNIYFKFLLNENGISLYDSTAIGPKLLDRNIAGGGQAKFSPDGETYAFYTVPSGLFIFDFDRSNGKLSNLRQLEIPHARAFTGLEFSANGRFIYISVLDTLYQYDLHNTGSIDALKVVGVWDMTSHPFQTTFCLMQRGPDCRIYMSSPSSTRTIHVINNPDGLGDACDFRQHGLDLNDRSTGTLSMPNFPNYRLGTGPVCDPSITTSSAEIFQPVQPMIVWPNPAHDVIHLDIPEDKAGGIYQIYDITGRLVAFASMPTMTLDVSISNFTKGVYVVRYIDRDGGAYSGKVVIE